MAENERAAGVLFRAPDGTVLLARRRGAAYDGHWAFPGGSIEEGETPEDAARREAQEETGRAVTGDLQPWTRRKRDGVDFTAFLSEGDKFTPQLNDEHDRHVWIEPHEALDTLKLHPGSVVSLLRFDLDELGIAKAMRAGEMTSPQRYHNVLLVALRITGTGSSYRQALDEYVWRDPSIYLNDDFLARCNGLPVILEHPEKNQLDSEEFRERTVGTILLPYIKGDEVWGIAKIYDDATAELLEREQLSTSPAVVFKDRDEEGTKYRLQDGSTLLIEGKPSLLDHLAICVLGVWDKGGAPSGVSNDSLNEGNSMATEDEKTEDGARKDESGAPENSKEGSQADKILAHLDSLHKRLDALEGRKDAEEEETKDDAESEEKLEKESEEDEKKAKDDAESKEEEDKEEDEDEDKRHDADEDEEEEESKKDSAFTALRKRLSSLERLIPREMSDEDRNRFVEVQDRAERVAQAFGDSAPRFLNGESLIDYRRRIARKFQKHSAKWRDVDLSKIADSAGLAVIEEQIYADAMDAAMHPVADSQPVLREVHEKDRAGRNITRFVGSPEACWGPFKAPGRLVAGIRNKFD